MPPKKNEDKTPAVLDIAKLRQLSQPLSMRALRMMEGGDVGQAIPLDRDGKGYSYEDVESLEYKALPERAGGGKYLCIASSQSDPAQQVKWYVHIPGAAVTPPDTRHATAHAELNANIADRQAIQDKAAMFPSFPPSPGAPPWWQAPMQTGAPGAAPQQAAPQQGYGSPWHPPPWQPGPYGYGSPYGMPQYAPQPTAPPVVDGRSQQLEEHVRRLETQLADEKRRSEQAEERRRFDEKTASERAERERREREIESRAQADRNAADQRHREMLGALEKFGASQQARPAVDPGDIERRLAAQQSEFVQRQREADTQREIASIRAETQREHAETQRQLAEATRKGEQESITSLTKQLLDQSQRSEDRIVKLFEKQSEAGRRSPLEDLRVLREFATDPFKDKLADAMLEQLNSPGGGATQMIGDVVSKLGDTAVEVFKVIGQSRASGGGRRDRARNAFRQIDAEQQRAPRQQVEARPRPAGGLNGAPAPANGTAPTNGHAGANGHAPVPAAAQDPPTGADQEGAQEAEKDGPPDVQAHMPDRQYFGVTLPDVVKLRVAYGKGEIQDPREIIAFIVEGYLQLTAAGIDIPALDDMEWHPHAFVGKLLPAGQEKHIQMLAKAYPPILKKKLDERDKAEMANGAGDEAEQGADGEPEQGADGEPEEQPS